MRLAIFLFSALAQWVAASNGTPTTDRFEVVLHDGLTADAVAPVVSALQESYDPVRARFGLEEIPTIRVQFWRDEESYQQAMEESLGGRAPGSRGYITGPTDVRLLLTDRGTRLSEAVHEFTHAVSLNANPDFGNNPRWLWEAVALYLAGEFVDPAQNESLRQRGCPSLELLNAPFDKGGTIYAVGYVLAEFIETTWGGDKLLELVRENGSIPSVLDMSESAFQRSWCAYLEETYWSG